MICKICGSEVPQGSRICDCGALQPPQAAIPGSALRSALSCPRMPMKWFKFIICFYLFFDAGLDVF
jgi:hypothetical protein